MPTQRAPVRECRHGVHVSTGERVGLQPPWGECMCMRGSLHLLQPQHTDVLRLLTKLPPPLNSDLRFCLSIFYFNIPSAKYSPGHIVGAQSTFAGLNWIKLN